MYVDIRNGQNNILESLPASFKFSNGNTTGNFRNLAISVQIANGFLPLTENKPEYDARIQTIIPNDVVIASDNKSASRIWNIATIPIDTLKNFRLNQINKLRDQKLDGGFVYNDVIYNSDQKAIDNVQGVILSLVIGASLSQDFTWRAKDDSFILMDEQHLNNLGIALRDFRYTVYSQSWRHKDIITALNTASDIVEYDIFSGW